MKLYLNATSPFARVARVAALEKGLQAQLQLCWCDPWSDEPQLLAANPIGRIPTLSTSDNHNLTETLLICLYLNQQSPNADLLPSTEFTTQLELCGLGLGLMEAAFNQVIARKYQSGDSDQQLLAQRRHAAINRTLGTLAQMPLEGNRLTLGPLMVGVALEYLTFRLAQYPWPERYPSLRLFVQQLHQHPHFANTAFT